MWPKRRAAKLSPAHLLRCRGAVLADASGEDLRGVGADGDHVDAAVCELVVGGGEGR